MLDAAVAEGVTFLDTADRYGETRSEQFIGEWLPGRRDQVVLATKFGADTGDGYEGPRGSADYIPRAVEASLRRLQTDTIDLYWYHRPDGVTPIAETLEALDALVRAGTVRAIGASNFSATQIADADRVAHERGFTRFCAIQNEYSLLAREAEADVLPLCERLGIAFIPFFPLASGLLTGKYRRNAPAPAGTRLAGRRELATDAQWTLLEAADGLRAGAGAGAHRGRNRGSAGPPGGELGDRRGNHSRAGQEQRQGRHMDPERGRADRVVRPARRARGLAGPSDRTQ